jgi:flagellar basal body-associated protein FliL
MTKGGRKMRKALLVIGIVLLVVLIVGVGGFFVYRYQNSPERLIIGKWESNINSYEFLEEGKLKIGTSINISSDGKYKINAENNTISITYTAFGLSYTNDFNYIFGDDNNTLTLTDLNLDKISMVYKRVVEEKE